MLEQCRTKEIRLAPGALEQQSWVHVTLEQYGDWTLKKTVKNTIEKLEREKTEQQDTIVELTRKKAEQQTNKQINK